MQPQARHRCIQLQIERSRLDRFLLRSTEPAEAGGKGIGDSKIHVRPDLFVVLGEVNPHPARLDDPERAFRGTCFDDRQKLARAVEQTSMARPRPRIDHDYSSACIGREPEHLTEIPIERNQGPSFPRCDVKHPVIGSRLQSLLANRPSETARRRCGSNFRRA